MSRLCRLKTASHGDDGKWAHNEIVSLRKQRDELRDALEEAVAGMGGSYALWEPKARAAIDRARGDSK